MSRLETLIDACQEKATTLYGQGVALEVDAQNSSRIYARVWNKAGTEELHTIRASTRTEALAELWNELVESEKRAG